MERNEFAGKLKFTALFLGAVGICALLTVGPTANFGMACLYILGGLAVVTVSMLAALFTLPRVVTLFGASDELAVGVGWAGGVLVFTPVAFGLIGQVLR